VGKGKAEQAGTGTEEGVLRNGDLIPIQLVSGGYSLVTRLLFSALLPLLARPISATERTTNLWNRLSIASQETTAPEQVRGKTYWYQDFSSRFLF
jgi:hypothetical protein